MMCLRCVSTVLTLTVSSAAISLLRFPCGEGAGYAGGIMSAAIDGQRTAAMLADAVG